MNLTDEATRPGKAGLEAQSRPRAGPIAVKGRILLVEDDPNLAALFKWHLERSFYEVDLDGAPLTGQSDHLANLQLGIEDTDSLSQMTFALTYASERVTNRGPIQGLARQPDFLEQPGLRLDFILRQEVPLFGARVELKFEARNLTGQGYEEYQEFEGNRIEINSYDVERSFSLGATARF